MLLLCPGAVKVMVAPPIMETIMAPGAVVVGAGRTIVS